jgi:PIN domain nuclease of toxin-antitoxin system
MAVQFAVESVSTLERNTHSDWLNQIEENSVAIIPVSRAIAERAVMLPEHHKDPVDRIIIATTIEHQAQLLSVDGRFPDYLEFAGLLV